MTAVSAAREGSQARLRREGGEGARTPPGKEGGRAGFLLDCRMVQQLKKIEVKVVETVEGKEELLGKMKNSLRREMYL